MTLFAVFAEIVLASGMFSLGLTLRTTLSDSWDYIQYHCPSRTVCRKRQIQINWGEWSIEPRNAGSKSSAWHAPLPKHQRSLSASSHSTEAGLFSGKPSPSDLQSAEAAGVSTSTGASRKARTQSAELRFNFNRLMSSSRVSTWAHWLFPSTRSRKSKFLRPIQNNTIVSWT